MEYDRYHICALKGFNICLEAQQFDISAGLLKQIP